MAPRGRPRKRSTRMDAALDAMRNLGFDEGVVTRTVKELLDIYGDDGWPFIEEYGYKELIDAILRGSETSKDENMVENDSTQIEVANVRPEDVAGSSNTASGQICSEVGDFAPEAENTIVKSPSSSTCNTVKNTDNRGGTPLAIEDISGRKEVTDYQSNQITSTQKVRCNDICVSSGNPEAEMNSQSACAVLAPVVASPKTPLILKDKSHDGRKMNSQSASAVHFSPPTSSQTPVDPQLVTPQSSRRRLPCYGWIDSDDEEEPVDLIHLTPVDPAKRPTQFARNLTR
ncbi:PREDICTED: uncharacterized protein LOC109148012 isoform X2 [Ipomoea nil]|uniref:uncharacterized protein LOC109148012 isoform X2 n=1 Tax=Ipomoea nil TaxID=35883 RepID=UPI000901A706|nr:PREDICTED: uncharacterized protein LOC109148012 isoform X2 [Ipomoea nil]